MIICYCGKQMDCGGGWDLEEYICNNCENADMGIFTIVRFVEDRFYIRVDSCNFVISSNSNRNLDKSIVESSIKENGLKQFVDNFIFG